MPQPIIERIKLICEYILKEEFALESGKSIYKPIGAGGGEEFLKTVRSNATQIRSITFIVLEIYIAN